MGTQRYLLSKLGQLFLTLLLILTLAFFLFRVWQPGDPVQTFARQSGAKYTPEQLAEIRHEWGLDIPLPQQYVRFMKEMLTFNFGVSTIVNPGDERQQDVLRSDGQVDHPDPARARSPRSRSGFCWGSTAAGDGRASSTTARWAARCCCTRYPSSSSGSSSSCCSSGLVHLFPSGRYEDNIATTRAPAHPQHRPPHVLAVAHADARVHGRVLSRDAKLAAGRARRGIHQPRPGQGCPREVRAPTSRGARTLCCRRSRWWPCRSASSSAV